MLLHRAGWSVGCYETVYRGRRWSRAGSVEGICKRRSRFKTGDGLVAQCLLELRNSKNRAGRGCANHTTHVTCNDPGLQNRRRITKTREGRVLLGSLLHGRGSSCARFLGSNGARPNDVVLQAARFSSDLPLDPSEVSLDLRLSRVTVSPVEPVFNILTHLLLKGKKYTGNYGNLKSSPYSNHLPSQLHSHTLSARIHNSTNLR